MSLEPPCGTALGLPTTVPSDEQSGEGADGPAEEANARHPIPPAREPRSWRQHPFPVTPDTASAPSTQLLPVKKSRLSGCDGPGLDLF